MRNIHSLLSVSAMLMPLAFLAADKGGGSGGAKSKVEAPTDGSITVPDGAEVIDQPISTAAPATVEQPVANPSEEAKRTYRATSAVDGKPLEIKERPARLAGNIASLAGFGGETAEDRTEAHQERAKLAAKADKGTDK